MTKSQQLNQRLTPETFNKLKFIAEKEGRTISNLLDKIIKDFLEARV